MARSNRREAGRRRLAMRLPHMRTLIMAACDPLQLELFEAYQMAVEARDSVRRRRFNPNLVREYDETCLEIEQHVIRAMQEPSYAQRTC
ncbi:hypothetical protein [Rhizobium leguminosarum]|jgi:hypothetical protein|uniref:Uncharacterized protein n=1 Tax=Rhizobium leguminosarum TaxID=384 RepID=A0A444NY84_RHILE|nr:hypothetical protein [Rhizobium leguminosarum]QND14528.1 hypothetical protein HB775_12095 [Rhizobium leguminosarum bv. trifolii]RWY80546.1 hypothetical protein EHI44_29985 [Rhizobium leguminosarum]TAU83212.1 hypothetical protein ELI40_07900 [Rhizobium leguminosarum]TAU88444.1 hypothetical protein ELI41_07610 [Rhizobium leguminosarum]TAV53095.1 hypothetical protein ELI29_08300 [Rhizobium leguminosarum]